VDEKKILRELYLETMQTRMLMENILQHQVMQACKTLNPLASKIDLQDAARETFQQDLMAIQVRIETLRSELDNAPE